MIVVALIVLFLLAFAAAVTVAIRARNMQYWLWGYLTRPKPPKVSSESAKALHPARGTAPKLGLKPTMPQ